MKELLRKGRDKFTKPLLCLIVPLTVLPFFWTTDSTPGKILLAVKFALMALLWLLHAELISLPENIGLGLVACSMAITVKLKGGAGIALLFIVMFLCFAIFPKITLTQRLKHRFFFSLSLCGCMVAMYGILMNILAGVGIFDIDGIWHPNLFGTIFIATYFSFLCYIYTMPDKLKQKILFGIVTPIVAIVIFVTNCRSALLAFVVSLGLQIVFAIWNKDRLYKVIHITIVICTVMICWIFLYLRFGNEMTYQELVDIPVFGKHFFTGREWVWRYVLRYIKTSFIIGNGNQYSLTLVDCTSAHNVPLGIMLCMGILPTLYYFFLQFRPGKLYSLKSKTTFQQRIPAICFMAAMTITAFECSLTDAQLNFLFLPLLLGCAPEPAKSEEVSHG